MIQEPADKQSSPTAPAHPQTARGTNTGRLALFLPDLRGGGAERVMLEVANAIASRGVAVDLLLVKAAGPYLRTLSPAVQVVDFGKARTTAAFIPLLRYLRRVRPAALLSTLDHVNVVALLARRLAGGPTRVVIREANMLSPVRAEAKSLRGRGMFALMHALYAGADAIITPSRGLAEDLRKNVRLPTSKVRIIYNPAVTPRLFELARTPLEHPWFVPGAPPVVVAAGRLIALKDFPTLLRAFAEVVRVRPARLLILGEGEERPKLEALARELDLGDRAALPGFVDNPFAFMARADAFVLSSRTEGLPNVLIQALALGTPVISTDCPSGPAEILAGGKYGTLVPVGDAPAMSEAILRALTAPPEPADPSRLEQFEVETVTEQYLQALGMDA